MEFGLPITTSQPVYQPYTTINYQTTQEVQNVGLGNTLATTEVYPVTSYSNFSAPINTTVINYEVVRPTYIETSTPALTTQDYTATAYQTEVTNPAPSTSSYNTIPAVNYYQGVAPPVATSAQQKLLLFLKQWLHINKLSLLEWNQDLLLNIPKFLLQKWSQWNKPNL